MPFGRYTKLVGSKDTWSQMGVRDHQGKGRFGGRAPAKTCSCKFRPNSLAVLCCHLANTNKELAIPPFAKLLWFGARYCIVDVAKCLFWPEGEQRWCDCDGGAIWDVSWPGWCVQWFYGRHLGPSRWNRQSALNSIWWQISVFITNSSFVFICMCELKRLLLTPFYIFFHFIDHLFVSICRYLPVPSDALCNLVSFTFWFLWCYFSMLHIRLFYLRIWQYSICNKLTQGFASANQSYMFVDFWSVFYAVYSFLSYQNILLCYFILQHSGAASVHAFVFNCHFHFLVSIHCFQYFDLWHTEFP